MRARIAIRVNPDVDAHTHAKISTGKSENKFGVPISRAREVYARAKALPGVEVDGVDMHIGSQIIELSPFDDAFALLADFVARAARPTGTRSATSTSAAASACPIASTTSRRRIPQRYAEIVARHTRSLDCEVFLEPGRLIVGNAGVLVTSVLYVKRGENKNFVIVDAAMNDLDPPDALRGASRDPPVREPALDDPRLVADIVGPVCESGDYLALDREMPAPRARRSASPC